MRAAGAAGRFLVNPQTGERLEFDRFYPPNWAFEFHGAQHDGPTERSSQAEVEAQQLRDLTGQEALIDLLEDASIAYRAASARRGRGKSPTGA